MYHIMRPLLRLPLCLMVAGILTACSSSSESSFDVTKTFLFAAEPAEPSVAFQALAETQPPAMIVSLQKYDEAYNSYLRQQVNTDGIETWVSQDELSLTMINGMIQGTRGNGGDLLAADASQSRRLILQLQEGRAKRFHTILDGNDLAQTLTFACEITRSGPREVDLGSYVAKTILMQEDCRNSTQDFRNFFWVTINSHDIVQSRQWISPYMQTLATRTIP